MKIVVEGPDNSGKSTLVRYLATALNLPVVPGEGPAKSELEINQRVERYNEIKGDVIFDRHPVVSQPIYSTFRNNWPIRDELARKVKAPEYFFIYCRGRGLEGHVVKDYDREDSSAGGTHEDMVNAHHEDICKLYDQWGLANAHLMYRIGDDMTKVAAVIRSVTDDFDPVRDIAEFHMKFGHEYIGPPRVLDREFADFRIRFMDEELSEYALHEAQASAEAFATHSAARDIANYTFHLEQMLDALVDEVYVVLGTAYLHGFNFREAWRRVHRANMRKVRATNAAQSKRGSTHDVIKPPGWEAPSHVDLVEQNDLVMRFR